MLILSNLCLFDNECHCGLSTLTKLDAYAGSGDKYMQSLVFPCIIKDMNAVCKSCHFFYIYHDNKNYL